MKKKKKKQVSYVVCYLFFNLLYYCNHNLLHLIYVLINIHFFPFVIFVKI
jgi:hypothetical protein